MPTKRTPWWRRFFGYSEHAHPLHTPTDVRTVFRVMYKDLEIGALTLDKGRWTFQYSDEFRKRGDLRPITDFPDVNRRYVSDHLWPFFFMRIPSLKQTDIQAIVQAE